MTSMRVLVTAFEPFGGSTTNITQQIISALPSPVGNVEIVSRCLPVSFHRAPVVLLQAVEELQPDRVLLLGQCPAGENIRLERFAINMMDSSKPDNDDYNPQEVVIDANAPLAFRTALDIKHMANICQEQGLAVAISNSAGLYVCNRVYYEALHAQQKALFVHIPKNMSETLAVNCVRKLVEML